VSGEMWNRGAMGEVVRVIEECCAEYVAYASSTSETWRMSHVGL